MPQTKFVIWLPFFCKVRFSALAAKALTETVSPVRSYYPYIRNGTRSSIIFSGSIVRADLLKCLLEGQGIQVFLQDETMGTLAPWYVAAGGAGAVKVLIPNSKLEEARPIVENFMKRGAEQDG